MVRSIISSSQRRVIIVVLLGVVYWGFTEYFQWAIPCPIRWLVGVPCPGCGMGRASLCLLHGDWQSAASIHFGSYILAFYVIYGMLPNSYKKYVEMTIPKALIKALGIVILLALIARWLLVLSGAVEGI